MEQQVKLQDILFPAGKQEQFNLYYQGKERRIDTQGKMVLEAGDRLDCAAYFNALSLCKWKEYSNVGRYQLQFTANGSFTVVLTGYSVKEEADLGKIADDGVREEEVYAREKSLYTGEKEILAQYDCAFTEPTAVCLDYPETDRMLVSFEIEAKTAVEISKGAYMGVLDPVYIRDVCLSLATTTFRKEEFITSNVAMLKKEILDAGDDMAENFYVHVVDNGRTLQADEIEGYHVYLHANPNTGGSGGYARGMLETIYQAKQATHVLLMDDDVLIQPESIRRVYRLLKVLKKEYDNHFISGAMIYYEQKNYQYEDVGHVKEDGSYGPVKSKKNLCWIEDCCANERPLAKEKYMYAGWWFCCIPMRYVREDNLPLPFFVRGDDVEYSLRNHAQFITMNGICVWHMGFTQKFNAMMELYQVHRNSLMLQAISGVCEDIDFLHRMKMFVRVELLRFNYNSVELLLEAVEDFMKGPHFLDAPNGENIIREKGKKNEKMRPLEEFSDIAYEGENIYEDIPISGWKLFLYRISYNGLYLPDFMLNDTPGVITYDWFYSKGRYALRKKLLAINVYSKEGAIRKLDRTRAKALKARAAKLFAACSAQLPQLREQYRAESKRLTSAVFWREYLDL